MRLSEYLLNLRTLGIELRLRDGRLLCDAPKGVLTTALRGEIGCRKEEIVAFLERGNAGGSAAQGGRPLAAMARSGPMPLTASQQRLWLMDRMHADRSAAFNVPSAVRIRGRLDGTLLQRSLAQIVRRHEVLRTTFPACEGIPHQVILSESIFSLQVDDLLHFPEDLRIAEAARQVEAEARRAFRIQEEPPFRAHLIRLEDEDHLLVLVLHLIACDEWAMDLVWNELKACYNSHVAGDAPELPPLDIQCADFAIWQRDWVERGGGQQQLDYWRKRLGGPLIPFELDPDPRLGGPSSNANSRGFCRLALDAGLSKSIASLARAKGATLFITLVAAFKALLCSYTFREDVLIGTSVATREQAGLRDLVGNFANTVVLRTDLSGNPDFLEILRRTRETVVEAFGRLDVPFETVVEALAAPRGTTGRPFFGCLFAMRNARSGPVGLRDLEISPWDVEPPSVEDGLSVYAQDDPSGLGLTCYYNPGLFRQSTIELLLERFRIVLQSVAKNPSVRLKELLGDPSQLGEKRAVSTKDGASHRGPGSRGGKASIRKRPPAFARDDLELQLTALWQELLGVRGISVQDDFFELGGNSFTAARLFARIERTLGYAMPLAMLYQASTIESLSDLLRRADRRPGWSPLVPIRIGGSRLPLFLVHGAEGNVLLYRELAHYLGDDQPVYGLQSEGLDPNREYTPRIEDLAASYVAAIRTVQPDGPYLVGGYCLGGTIAFEMAQQLRAAGCEVALVAMLETYNIKSTKYHKRFYHPLIHQLQNILFHLQNILALRARERRDFLRRKLRVEISRISMNVEHAASILGRWRRSPGSAYQHVRVGKANDAAQVAYVPKAYEGKLVIFRPRHDFLGHYDHAMGWDDLAMSGVDVHELPVAPRGILVEPFVRELAKELRACMP